MKKLQIKKLLTAALLAILPIVNIAPVSAAEEVETPWGPERKTFTWDNPATYATFNSITNNPQIGDERDFVRIREINDQSTYGDEVTLEPGKTYEVYIYYHNNADGHEVGKTAVGIADGAAVKSSFPATVKAGEKATVTGTVFANDTDPLAVWDGAYMTASEDLYLRYVPGTAIIHNGGELNGQNIGPDYLFGEGALLGYNQFSGILPGCNQYAGYITYNIFADAPGFSVQKSIISDAQSYKAGDEITFKVRYENTGTMDQLNVVVRDTLPEGLTYVPGSAMLYNNNLTEGKAVNDDIITENGMNIGDYAGGSGWAEVTYKAKVNDDQKCGGELENSVTVSTTDGNKTSSVKIVIEGEDCTPTPPVTPETPKEIVKTGPLEITMAVVVILAVAGGGFYFYRTRKTLKTVEGVVTGPEGGANPTTPDAPSAPINPTTPESPIAPVNPITPATPQTPTEPISPAEPQTPEAPAQPASFSAPVNPIAPQDPIAPSNPEAPNENPGQTPPNPLAQQNKREQNLRDDSRRFLPKLTPCQD